MKKTLLSTLSVAALLLGASTASAQQESKPLVVVSFAGYDEFKSDLTYLGKLGGNPQIADGLEGLLGIFTGGQGLAGIDKARPWGAAVTTDGFQFSTLAFLPVTDLDQLLGTLGMFVEPKDAGDGIKEIQVGENPLYVKGQGSWAFLARDTLTLGTLPDDPGKFLQGLDKDYDLAVRAYMSNVPDVFKQMGIDQLKIGVEQGLQPEEDETDEEFQTRVTVTKQQVDAMITMINDLNEFTVGWSIDQTNGQTYLDFGATALPDTKTAAKFAQLSGLTSNFAGFLRDDSMFTMHMTQTIAQDDIDQLLTTLKAFESQVDKEVEKSEDFDSDEEKAMAKDMITKLLGVTRKTIQAGKLDGGMAIVGDKTFTIVGGGFAAETATITELLTTAVKWGEMKNEVKDARLNEETADGVTYHSFLPAEEPEEDDIEFFGEQPRITVGIGESAVYFAIGSNGIPAIKEAIATSAARQSEEVSPLNISIALAPIVRIAAKDDPDNANLQMIASQLKDTGKDHIRVLYKLIPNGAITRILAEEDVLTLFGKAASMGAAAAGGGGGFPPPGDGGNDDF